MFGVSLSLSPFLFLSVSRSPSLFFLLSSPSPFFARITRMLAITGMLPSATYSSKLLGMGSSQLNRGWALPHHHTRHPMGNSELGISVGVELIRSWWTWWNDHSAQHRAAERAWSIIRPRIEQLPPTRRWRRVGGHIAAVITTLLDAGWNPCSATYWEDPDGGEWNATTTDTVVDLSPSCQPLPRRSATPSGHRPRPIGTEAVPNSASTFTPCACSFSS